MAKDPEPRSAVTRRGFLGGAAAGAAAGAFGAWSRASAQVPTIAQDLRTDVVIVGSGIGGLTAAVRAQKAGARVIVLEKAYEPGGTTAHSEGSVANNRFETLREDTPNGDPEVQRTVCDNVPRFYEFMDSLGAPIAGGGGGATPPAGQPAAGAQGGGRSRSIAPVAWVGFMVDAVESAGGRVMVETAMIRLLTNRLYEVIGVLAEGPNGPMRILAKSVVLATGGWMGNGQMVTQNITRHFGSLHQRNAAFGGRKPLLTGDGLFAATQLGAATSEGGFDGFYGHMMPARPTKPMHNPLSNYSMYHGPYSVVVNLYGRRFADETQGKQAGPPRGGGEQLINQEVARQPEATAAYIWDEPVNVERACADCALGDRDKFPAFREIGAPVATANTLQELAAQMEGWGRGIPAAEVMRQLTEYNQAAENGKAWALPIPKAIAAQAVPIKTPPFYAVLGQAGITATHGGLRVNAQGQVLSRTGRPIKGLYAAGVDIGNFNNYVYHGNLCIGAAFGYVSGYNAAKQVEPRGGWEIGPMTTG
jgi:succinate dehydrogenase/fumarate reductase flavoprotein subunit